MFRSQTREETSSCQAYKSFNNWTTVESRQRRWIQLFSQIIFVFHKLNFSNYFTPDWHETFCGVTAPPITSAFQWMMIHTLRLTWPNFIYFFITSSFRTRKRQMTGCERSDVARTKFIIITIMKETIFCLQFAREKNCRVTFTIKFDWFFFFYGARESTKAGMTCGRNKFGLIHTNCSMSKGGCALDESIKTL